MSDICFFLANAKRSVERGKATISKLVSMNYDFDGQLDLYQSQPAYFEVPDTEEDLLYISENPVGQRDSFWIENTEESTTSYNSHWE